MKKFIIVVVIIFIILGVSGFLFVLDFKKDQTETRQKMLEVSKNYSVFNEKITEYAKLREEVYNSLKDTYLEELSKNCSNLNDLIVKYENSIKAVENASSNLKDICTIKFNDASANNKCTTFKANYEAANNYYISDIKSYNKTVENYNKWAESGNYDKLNKGEFVVYKKYIDFDEDGEYFGKESSNEE